MGNAKSSAISQALLDDLRQRTNFSEAELSRWFGEFRRECPTERVSQPEFERIYQRLFPDSDAQAYSSHVFRSFDVNDDGTLDFSEYIIALHLTSSGLTSLKLEWVFSLYDVDKSGAITKGEVLEITRAIFKLIPEEETKDLPEDENTAEKRADKLWSYFGKKEKEKLLEGEFIKGVLENENALRLIQYEPKKK
ncbi:VISI protein, partial [Polyodon spathula]|nr:recoverin 2 [Polyodon spathula]MBN3271084.1 VISI protein [Polyodon spathula]